MRGPSPTINDEDLHGFVDGEIPPDRRVAVEAFLAGSSADAEKVEEWRRLGEMLRCTFARVETEQTPASILLPRPARKRTLLCQLRPSAAQDLANSQPGRRVSGGAPSGMAKAGRLAMAFAAGAFAALSGAFFIDHLHEAPGRGADRSPTTADADDRLTARARSAFAAFAPQISAKPSNSASDVARVAKAPITLVIPNLSGDGLALVGARPAPDPSGADTQDMFCLFYAGAAAEPTVALCIARAEPGGGSGFRVVELEPAGQKLISWRQGNAFYSLAAALSEARLRDLALRVSAEVAAFAR